MAAWLVHQRNHDPTGRWCWRKSHGGKRPASARQRDASAWRMQKQNSGSRGVAFRFSASARVCAGGNQQQAQLNQRGAKRAHGRGALGLAYQLPGLAHEGAGRPRGACAVHPSRAKGQGASRTRNRAMVLRSTVRGAPRAYDHRHDMGTPTWGIVSAVGDGQAPRNAAASQEQHQLPATRAAGPRPGSTAAASPTRQSCQPDRR